MDKDGTEIECPVCDRKISADSRTCPGCGADFTSSGVDQLEDLVRQFGEKGPKEMRTQKDNVTEDVQGPPLNKEEIDSNVHTEEREGGPFIEDQKDEPAPSEGPSDNGPYKEKRSGLFKRLFGKNK